MQEILHFFTFFLHFSARSGWILAIARPRAHAERPPKRGPTGAPSVAVAYTGRLPPPGSGKTVPR